MSRSLSDILQCFWKIVQAYNYFCRTLLLSPFQMFGRILNTPMYLYLACIRFCFRHVQTYSSAIQEHIHAYSELSVALAYSKPWHIPITKHIQTLRYIHNTTLNIFTNAQSWKFNANLTASLFYRCYLTFRVTLHIFSAIFQNYSDIIKTYSAIFSPVKAC